LALITGTKLDVLRQTTLIYTQPHASKTGTAINQSTKDYLRKLSVCFGFFLASFCSKPVPLIVLPGIRI